jgi:hypothetical protein
MEKMKYINSKYRIIISHDSVYNGIKNAYTSVEIHFLEEEIDCRNETLVLAFGETLKSAIRRTGKNTVDWYNKETCMKDKYLKIYLTAGVSVEETEEMILDACEFIEKKRFDKSKQGKIYELIFRHESEIRECAYEIEEAILDKKDYNCIHQIIVLPVRKRKDNRNNENN